MSSTVLVMREGAHLVAAEPMSLEAIERLPRGVALAVTIRRPRNEKHHRKLWALIGAVFESQLVFATTEELLDAIKMATGLFETRKTVEGLTFNKPSSISFAAMDQARFEVWYEKAVEVIVTRIIPGANSKELEARVTEILEGRG